jgi:integrase
LTDEGTEFFCSLGSVAGPILGEWREGMQGRYMREACKRAGVDYANFHALRHSWASLSVMAGMPLMVVAKNLGHVDTRMVEKHYGHLAPSFIADAIRAAAPRFGMVEKSNVRSR